MKNTLLLSLVCLGLGFAAGWIAKPVPASALTINGAPVEASSRKGVAHSEKARSASERDKAKVAEAVAGSDRPETDPKTKEAIEKAKNDWTERIGKRQQDKLDARIAKLVAQLGLSPEQEATLRKALEGKAKGLESVFSGDIDPSNVGEIASLLGGDGVDEALDDLLTPEQKEAYEALKKRELANKVEASALKNLAKLSFLDLTQEQKDAAYDILYNAAEKDTAEVSPQASIISAVTDGFGLEIDLDDLGLAEAFTGGGTAAGETPNPIEMMKRAKETMAKRIDEKVEVLRPVLTETQLEQYRNNLESKSGGLFGGFLGGGASGEAEDTGE